MTETRKYIGKTISHSGDLIRVWELPNGERTILNEDGEMDIINLERRDNE